MNRRYNPRNFDGVSSVVDPANPLFTGPAQFAAGANVSGTLDVIGDSNFQNAVVETFTSTGPANLKGESVFHKTLQVNESFTVNGPSTLNNQLTVNAVTELVGGANVVGQFGIANFPNVGTTLLDFGAKFIEVQEYFESMGETIWAALSPLQTTVGELFATMTTMGASIGSLQTTMTTMGTSIGSLQTTVTTMGTSISSLQDSVGYLQGLWDDWLSDERLKSNTLKLTDHDEFADKVKRIEMFEFDRQLPFKDGSKHISAGVIAQQVKDIYPAATTTNAGIIAVVRNRSTSVVYGTDDISITFEAKHQLPFQSGMELILECDVPCRQRVTVHAIVDDVTVRVSIPATGEFDSCIMCGVVANELMAIDPYGMNMLLLGATKALIAKVEQLERKLENK